MRDWLVLLAVGVGTYVMRVAFLVSHRTAPPATVQRALPFIGPAVLGAMVAPALVLPGGSLSIQTVPALVAAAACALVWWRFTSLPLALLAGLLTAWATGAALGI
jgi:branched-subunit amino acid transport protein